MADISLTNVASGSSSPRLARSQIYDAIQRLNYITQTFVHVASYGAKGDGVTNDTSAILSANAGALLLGATLVWHAGTYLYTPTAPLECGMWVGESMESVIIKADCSAYTGNKVVFRLTKSSEWRDLSIYEKNGSTANGILVQLSDTTATNVAGGANTFSAYTDLHRVRIIGGAIALDIGNMFTCRFDACQFRQAGLGVRIVATDDAGDNGYSNTLTFISCEISENGQNWLANGIGSQIKGLLVLGGSTERCTTTSSSFTNLQGASFIGHYIEQTAAVSPMTFVGCVGLYLRLIPVGTQCDLTLGTNTEVTIEGWINGSSTSRLLGGDGTQTVSLRGCTFPTSGNSPFSDFAKFSAYGSSYNGVFYDNYAPTLEAPEKNRIHQQTTVVTGGSATDVYLFRNGRASAQNSQLAGILNITAVDTSTGANACSYVYALTANANGASQATLTQLARTVRGTDPGTSTTPFSLAADGGGGAVKVQFTKNAAISSVTVKAQFMGLVA